MANNVPELVFKGEEIRQLDELIGQVPTKQGLPLVNFINSIAQKRNQEAQLQAKIESTKTADSLPVTTGTDEVK